MTFKQLIWSISKKEWQFVIIIGFILILVTGLPYVYAYINAQEGSFYNGLHFLTSGDIFVYYSYINQIKEGNWLLKDYFTSELQTTGLLNLFWLGVGLMARFLNLSAFFAFQISRLLLIPLFLAVLYVFISYFFSDRQKRKLAFLFACFSSGVGAYFNGFYYLFSTAVSEQLYKWPIDLWVPESNIFLSLYHNSHFILSWSLMIFLFLFMLLAWQNNKYCYSLWAGLAGLLWFNFHPYYFPYVFIILFIYGFALFLKTRQISILYHYLLSLILSLPFVLYHFYMIRTDLVIGVRASQNITLTSPLIFVLTGFGFLLIFGLLGIYCLIKNKEIFKNEKFLFLAIWLICSWLLIYAPVDFQRRFLEGMQLPMVIFSIIALFNLAELIKIKFFKLYDFLDGNHCFLILLFAVFFGLSNLFVLIADIYYFKNNFFIYYFPNEYKTAATWLNNNNPRNKVIVSQSYDSWAISGLVNKRIFLGHGHETIFADVKGKILDNFFADKFSENEARKFLSENGIGFLFFSDIERKFYKYNPAQKTYFKKVWQEGEVEIWQVLDE